MKRCHYHWFAFFDSRNQFAERLDTDVTRTLEKAHREQFQNSVGLKDARLACVDCCEKLQSQKYKKTTTQAIGRKGNQRANFRIRPS